MRSHVNQKWAWMLVIKNDIMFGEGNPLHRPVRWRLLRRIWNVGLPCGTWGRETPF